MPDVREGRSESEKRGIDRLLHPTHKLLMFLHWWLTVSLEGLMPAEQIRNSFILCVVGYSFGKKEKNSPPYLI